MRSVWNQLTWSKHEEGIAEVQFVKKAGSQKVGCQRNEDDQDEGKWRQLVGAALEEQGKERKVNVSRYARTNIKASLTHNIQAHE